MRSHILSFIASVLLITCLSLPMRAEDESPSEQSEGKPVPEILDFYERDAELYRFELTPYAGAYLGDTLQDSFYAGGMFDVRLTPKMSLGVDFGWAPISFDSTSNFGSLITNNNLYSIQGVVTINMPAAFLSQRGVVETDFFTTVGGGILRINNSNRGDGFIGGGMKVYLRKLRWLALRTEVRSYFSSVRSTDGNDFTTDWVFTFGPTFMIPPKLF